MSFIIRLRNAIHVTILLSQIVTWIAFRKRIMNDMSSLHELSLDDERHVSVEPQSPPRNLEISFGDLYIGGQLNAEYLQIHLARIKTIHNVPLALITEAAEEANRPDRIAQVAQGDLQGRTDKLRENYFEDLKD